MEEDMKDTLRFDENEYERKTLTLGDKTVTYRAFTGINYCKFPKDPIQKLNIFVPEEYYNKGVKNGYTLHTAPIFMPNTVGGYMEGPAMEPGIDPFNGNPNTAFEALFHGYVVAAAGIRGRNTGMESKEFFVGGNAKASETSGNVPVGRAPALIVDQKAAIRYLRHNADVIPGNVNHIITNGTSAGGALSALTGATGNAEDYEPYLKEIGAAEERDDIFGASCYCPIHNLEHADAAYEWLFNGENEYHRVNFVKTDHGVEPRPELGKMSEKRIRISDELKPLFPPYVNSLELQDADGKTLTLDADGEGSFKEYVASKLVESAQKELDTHWSAKKGKLMVPSAKIEEQEYLSVENGKVTGLDWKAFVKRITRMKLAPAFDDVALNSPECEEFGDDKVFARHFSKYSEDHTEVPAEMADEKVIRMLNPTCYIGSKEADTCPHWRIRHGAFDRDTSLAIPAILALLLEKDGKDVDFFLPWGLPHSGDYDLDELFAWIDRICEE